MFAADLEKWITESFQEYLSEFGVDVDTWWGKIGFSCYATASVQGGVQWCDSENNWEKIFLENVNTKREL